MKRTGYLICTITTMSLFAEHGFAGKELQLYSYGFEKTDDSVYAKSKHFTKMKVKTNTKESPQVFSSLLSAQSIDNFYLVLRAKIKKGTLGVGLQDESGNWIKGCEPKKFQAVGKHKAKIRESIHFKGINVSKVRIAFTNGKPGFETQFTVTDVYLSKTGPLLRKSGAENTLIANMIHPVGFVPTPPPQKVNHTCGCTHSSNDSHESRGDGKGYNNHNDSRW